MSRLMSPQSWRPRALWLAWALVTVGLVAVAQWEGRRQQHSRLEAFGGDLQNVAQVSATILTQRLQQLDDVLLVLRAAYKVDPDSLGATIDLLRHGPLADRDLQVVRVDRAGLLAYADTPGAKPGMYLGDRSYFKFFADGAADQFLVDEPVLGRVTQRLSLPLVRPVYRPDGSFDGVLALSVTQASLTEFGARLQFSPDTVVGLFNLDGALVSRSRDLPALKGSRLAPMQMAPFLSEPYGVLDHVSPLDGVTRLAAFRRLAPLPLVVVVAADPGPLKRQTSLEISALTFGACLMSAALGVLLYYLSRALQRRREAALLLASSEARLRAVLAVMADGVVVLGPDGNAQSWNAAAERILGETHCRELGLPGSGGTGTWIGEDGVALGTSQHPARCALEQGLSVDRAIVGLRRADGELLWLRMSSRPLVGVLGQAGQAVAVSFSDITALRQAALDGRMAQAIFENIAQPVVVTDADARIVMMNPAAAAVTGFSVQEALGQRPSLWRSNRHDAAFYEQMWRAILDNGQWVGDIWNRNKEGVAFPVLLSVTAVRDPSSLATRYVGIYTDITERKRSEEDLWRRANFDVLTGLPNRMLLHERLDRALARAGREASAVALLFVDLDGFKPINDRFGHHAGDAVLHGVAERMQSKIRESDTAARLGGDEFVILLQAVGSEDDVRQVAQAVLAAVQEPLKWEGQAIGVSCSIGIALFSRHAQDREGLLAQADAAMYRAKAAGKGRVSL